MTIQAVEVQNRYEIYLSFCEETQSTPVEFEDWAEAEGYDVDPEFGPLETRKAGKSRDCEARQEDAIETLSCLKRLIN